MILDMCLLAFVVYRYKYTDAASENPINKSIVTTETSNSITGKLNQEPR